MGETCDTARRLAAQETAEGLEGPLQLGDVDALVPLGGPARAPWRGGEPTRPRRRAARARRPAGRARRSPAAAAAARRGPPPPPGKGERRHDRPETARVERV